MTCDNNRPCERCVARGLADTCRDGVRKKAKYLDDVSDAVATSDESMKYDPRYANVDIGKTEPEPVKSDNLAQLPKTELCTPEYQYPLDKSLQNNLDSSSPYNILNGPSSTPNTGDTHDITRSLVNPQVNTPAPTTQLVPGISPYRSAISNWPLSGTRPNRHKFQSMAANLEYSLISDIVTGSKMSDLNTSSISPSLSSTDESPVPRNDYFTSQISQQQQLVHPHSNSLNQFSLGSGSPNENAHSLSDVLESVEQLNNNEWPSDTSNGLKRPLSFTISTSPSENSVFLFGSRRGSRLSPAFSAGGPQQFNAGWHHPHREPADIYANVRQPYSYTPAYHQLTVYIRTRFNREQQLRIAKCMASYRPSFIACTNTLEKDDLIFMEQCFQRTLLEYEKFISYSGTPTVVWRRTGQVAAVGKEFCILTGWQRERLLNENAFIVELMDDLSALEYFEMFSKMAFGDSRGANMTDCTLLTPQGKKIRTTSIWTLKRDVFGIPMMIVGNFLPILS